MRSTTEIIITNRRLALGRVSIPWYWYSGATDAAPTPSHRLTGTAPPPSFMIPFSFILCVNKLKKTTTTTTLDLTLVLFLSSWVYSSSSSSSSSCVRRSRVHRVRTMGARENDAIRTFGALILLLLLLLLLFRRVVVVLLHSRSKTHKQPNTSMNRLLVIISPPPPPPPVS